MNKMKAKAIAKSYIKNKFNCSKTGLEVYNTKSSDSAKAMMNKALKNPQVQSEIQQQLAKEGIDQEFINKHFKTAIENNLKLGKPSQAVGAQLLIQAQKIYNYLPKDSKTVVKQERKVLLDQDFNKLKEELTQTISTTQDLLNDLNS